MVIVQMGKDAHMKKSRKTIGIAISLFLSLGVLLPLPARATEPADGAQGEETHNQAKSGDNSLSTLSISPGTLSPDFQYSVINYTASVGADVTSVDVDAKTSNAAAKIVSITGNEGLEEGENTISISVEAENGAPVTYKIVVTRGAGGEGQAGGEDAAAQDGDASGQEGGAGSQGQDAGQGAQEGADGITLNGHSFHLADTVPEDRIPQGFSAREVNCMGQQVQGLQFDKLPSLVLVYLTTPSQDVKNTLAVYEEASGSFSPFRKAEVGEGYFILLDPPADAVLSEAYTRTSGTLGGFEDVPIFTQGGGEEFSLVYAASSHGNIGWYQYDTVEGTFQRYVQGEEAVGSSPASGTEGDSEEASAQMQGLRNAYKDLEEQYNHKKETSRKTISVLLFLVAVLAIIILNLLLRRRHREDGEWEEEGEGIDYAEPSPRRARRSRRETEEAWIDEDGEEPSPSSARKKRQGKKEWADDSVRYGSERIGKGKGSRMGMGHSRDREDRWQEEDPIFAELNPRIKKRAQEKDDWDQKGLGAEKDDWDQHAPLPEKDDWDAPKPKRVLSETAELKLDDRDDGFEVIDLEDL
jgi:hypothetical protein